MVKCSCGAVVRKHMMPKHVQKDKHKRILAALSEALPPPPAPSGYALQPPLTPSSAITAADPLQLPPPNPGPLPAIPSIYRADYSSSSSYSMMPQPSLLAVQYGMSMSMSMPMFQPYQWVYQTSAPPMFATTPSHQNVEAPPMSPWDELSHRFPMQWQR